MIVPTHSNTVAIIQARMGSTRLPGKVMLGLPGGAVLAWVVRRVRACPLVDRVVVATSVLAEDDVVADEARRCGADVFRGDPLNVLSRYCGAAAEFDAATVIRITSDCPLYDPTVLTMMLERFRAEAGRIDYLTNGGPAYFYPRGLDTEIFSRPTLETVCQEASQPYELEHVTPYIYQHKSRFKVAGCKNGVDLSQHRWTLDTPDDWLLIKAIYDALSDGERIFSTPEVLEYLEAHPEVVAFNAHVKQKQLGE